VLDDADKVKTGDQLTMTLKHGIVVSEVKTVTKE
jgi:exodeoxyribonuclease VII large subunit